MTRMQAYPAEQRIGHMQHYHTRNGRILKLARTRLDPWPEPRQMREEPDEPFWQVLGVWLLLCASLYLLVAVGAAVYAPEPQQAAPIVEPAEPGLIR